MEIEHGAIVKSNVFPIESTALQLRKDTRLHLKRRLGEVHNSFSSYENLSRPCVVLYSVPTFPIKEGVMWLTGQATF